MELFLSLRVSSCTLIMKTIQEYLKDKKPLKNLTLEQKEDLGLLFLMEQVDRNDTVSEEEIFKLLK